jgi:hypothetical protein
MRGRAGAVLQCLLLAPMVWAGGCIIGFKPASETILAFRPQDPESEIPPVSFGVPYVYWDQLHHGYGVVGDGYDAGDHKAYFYFWYDPGDGPDVVDGKDILITPFRSQPGKGMTYQLEWRIHSTRFTPGRREPIEWRSAAIIGPPVRDDDMIRFDMRAITVNGPWPEPMILSGQIAAYRTDTKEFEYQLSQWNKYLHSETK